MQELLAKGVPPLTAFSANGLDGLFEQIRTTGAEVLQEPIQRPWVPKGCAFRDPSGNMIRLNQRQARPAQQNPGPGHRRNDDAPVHVLPDVPSGSAGSGRWVRVPPADRGVRAPGPAERAPGPAAARPVPGE